MEIRKSIVAIFSTCLVASAVLNLAGLTLNSGVINFELGAPASSDKIALTELSPPRE